MADLVFHPPTAAARHAEVARVRSGGVGLRAARVVARPVETPLEHVTGQVVEASGVGRLVGFVGRADHRARARLDPEQRRSEIGHGAVSGRLRPGRRRGRGAGNRERKGAERTEEPGQRARRKSDGDRGRSRGGRSDAPKGGRPWGELGHRSGGECALAAVQRRGGFWEKTARLCVGYSEGRKERRRGVGSDQS